MLLTAEEIGGGILNTQGCSGILAVRLIIPQCQNGMHKRFANRDHIFLTEVQGLGTGEGLR